MTQQEYGAGAGGETLYRGDSGGSCWLSFNGRRAPREAKVRGRLERAGVADEFEDIRCRESLCRLVLPGLGAEQTKASRGVAREEFPVPEIDDR